MKTKAKTKPKKIASKASKPKQAWQPKKPVLMMRTCDANMRGHGGFQWPNDGYVEAPDWKAHTRCGNGLHGLLWGSGGAGYLSTAEDAKWLAVEVCETELIVVDDKIKVPRGRVVITGSRHDVANFIAARAPSGVNVHYATATAGDYGTATAGDYGTATAGYRGTATAGDYGTATAGDYGTATAGDYGTATAGSGGTATAGDYGTATAGSGGTVAIRYYDPKREKYRVAVAEIGENGIEPDTAYMFDVELRKFVAKDVKEPTA